MSSQPKSSRWRCLYLSAAGLTLLACASMAVAEQDVRSKFTRLSEDDQGQPRALQLAVVSYVPKKGRRNVQVDLIAAVHVADEDFYASLNEAFQAYDALLYELVAPKGMVIKPGMKPKGFITGAQRMMAQWLALSLQLEKIDYTAKNFVHADLTPGEFTDAMAQRNESVYTYVWSLFFASMREYQRDPLGIRSWRMLIDGATTARSHPIKIMMAHEFADLDRMENMLGTDADTTIIGARNQRAIDVLQQQLDSGKKRVGIFYGAAHMRDLENRLLAIGFVPVETAWTDAWML